MSPPPTGAVVTAHETTARETLLVTTGAAATAVAAMAAMGATGLLPVPGAVLAAVLAVVAIAGPVHWPSGRAAVRRRQVATPVLVGVAVASVLLLIFRAGWEAGGDPDELLASIGRTLSWTIAALIVLQLASAVTLRHVGICLVGCFLAVVLCIVTAPDEKVDVLSGLGGCLLFGWTTGVITLWLINRAMDRLGVQHVMPGGRPPSLREPALLVVCSLVVGLLALAVLPDLDGLRLQQGPAGPPVPGSPSQGTGSAGAARSPQSYLSGMMNLNARGDLPTTDLVEVPADSPGLWAASQLDVYTGSAWETSGSFAVASVPLDGTGEYDLRGPADDEALSTAPADSVDQVRPLDPSTVLPLLAPGKPVGVRIHDLLAAYPGSMVIPGNTGIPYVMRSRSRITGPVTATDTALPASLPARVRDLAVQLAHDAPTAVAKAAAIESYLSAEMRYRLDSPVPDAGEDAVDDFLFESKEGFCEHFAAAEVVLLRALGVPARVVTGFAGGARLGDVRVLRGSDAHAWVQVYAGDGQWFWSDPTAGAQLAEDRPSPLDLLRAHAWLLAGLLLALVLAGMAAFLVLRWLRARRAAARAAAAPLAAKVMVAFGALETALATTPLARAPDASIAELQRALARRWPGGLPDAGRVEQALATVQRILYDAVPVPADRAVDAIAALTALTAQASELRPRKRRLPVG